MQDIIWATKDSSETRVIGQSASLWDAVAIGSSYIREHGGYFTIAGVQLAS